MPRVKSPFLLVYYDLPCRSMHSETQAASIGGKGNSLNIVMLHMLRDIARG